MGGRGGGETLTSFSFFSVLPNFLSLADKIRMAPLCSCDKCCHHVYRHPMDASIFSERRGIFYNPLPLEEERN